MLERLLKIDRELLIYFNSLSSEKFDPFWEIITSIFTWIPLLIFFIFLFFRTYQKPKALKSVLLSFASLAVVNLLVFAVKESVMRLRPINEPLLAGFVRTIQIPHDYYSFFSGHASNSFAITTFVVLCLRFKYKWVYLFYIFPLLFCFSRLYLGVHYPSDILVGAFVGILISASFYQIHKKI